MNDHLKCSPHGLRLIQEFEGSPRLTARLCEGNRWELGWGCTYYPDNSPVAEGDTIELPFATVMLEHALSVTEEAVKRLVTVPLNQHQFDGLCGFVYNVGEANAATSTVIRETNAGRFDDAAAAFGMWLYATTGGGHKQALRGLLRRRYAEAATYLGYRFDEACADEAIALQREKPASLPGKDRVIYKTPFKDVLRVAQRYPLAPATQQAPEAKPAPVAVAPIPDSAIAIPNTPASPVAPADMAGQPEFKPPSPAPAAPAPQNPAATVSGPAAGPAATKAVAPASSLPVSIEKPKEAEKPKAPVVITPKAIDPKSIPYGEVDPTQATNMSGSRRVAGMVVVGLGSMTQILAAREIVSSSVGAVFYDMSRDPIVVALLIGGAFWVFGWLTRKRGTAIVAKGMAEATSLLK